MIPHCQSAEMGKALACLHGLEITLNNSNCNLIIETDCSSILKSFGDDGQDRSEVGLIAREFKLKKPPDREVLLVKVNRSCNSVAHELCQLRRRELSGGVLLSAVPTCVSRSAWFDCNQIVFHD